jgi:uncharacterized Zn-finger protein
LLLYTPHTTAFKEWEIEVTADIQPCGKGFAERASLKKHLRTHSGKKPFPCPVAGCIMAFSTSNNMNRHRLIHDVVKPFVCNFAECGKAFVREKLLTRFVLQV